MARFTDGKVPDREPAGLLAPAISINGASDLQRHQAVFSGAFLPSVRVDTLGGMTSPDYRRLSLAVRPVRIAYLVPHSASWTDLLGCITEFTGYWGGAHFILVPVRADGSIHAALWRLLQVYDPDRIGGSFVPATSCLERMRRLLSIQDLDVDAWLAAFDNRRDLLWLALPMADVLPLEDEKGNGVGFRLEHVVCGIRDQRAQLAFGSQYGILSDLYRAKLAESGAEFLTTEVPLENSLNHLDAAWVPPAAYGIGEWPGSVWPFPLSQVGCRTYWRGAVRRAPFTVVVGETVEDYCLYYGLARLLGEAAWFPTSLVESEDVLAQVWRNSVVGQLDAMATHSQGRQLLVTSASLAEDAVEEARQRLTRGAALEKTRTCSAVGVPLDRIRWIWDRHRVEEVRYEPFAGERMIGTLPPLEPSLRMSGAMNNPEWFVDVEIERWTAPSRGCLGAAVNAGRNIDAYNLRIGREGVTYNSQGQGLIRGVREDEKIAQPRLALPDAHRQFSILCDQAGLKIRPSAAGGYTAGSIALFGSLRTFAQVFQVNVTRSLFGAYLMGSPKKQPKADRGPKPAGTFLEGVQRRFLTLAEMVAACKLPEDEMRGLVDGWCEGGVLRRGLILKCPTCLYAGWYALGEVDEAFRCGRCRASSKVTRGTWLADTPEPVFSYDLHEVVYQALRHDCHVPVLALASMEAGSGKFLYLPDQTVFRGGEVLCEVDIWAIADGRIILGEAKATDHLETTAAKERASARRFADVAAGITADEVVYVSTKEWRDATQKCVRDAFAGSDVDVRFVSNLGREGIPFSEQMK